MKEIYFLGDGRKVSPIFTAKSDTKTFVPIEILFVSSRFQSQIEIVLRTKRTDSLDWNGDESWIGIIGLGEDFVLKFEY